MLTQSIYEKSHYLWTMAKSYVYLVSNPFKKTTKIGKANNPRARFGALRTGSPELKLKLLIAFASEQEAHSAEQMLHHYFKDDRIELEWFRMNGSHRQLALEYAQTLPGYVSFQDTFPLSDKDIKKQRIQASIKKEIMDCRRLNKHRF